MSILLEGYLRDNPGGAALAGLTVSLLDVNTDLAPVTNAHTNLSGTTDVTDAAGYWGFTMDLMTGPLYVSAALGGGNFRYRRNREQFTYNAFPINRLPRILSGMGTGVLHGVGLDMLVTAGAARLLTIDDGYAAMKGYALGWDSGDKTMTGNANGAAGTTRHDFLCLRQWYEGTLKGKQDIVLIEGGSSADPVVTSVEADLTKFIRGANIYDLPIYRAKMANGSTVYTLDDLRGHMDYPWAGNYFTNVIQSVIFGNDVTVNDDLTVSGDLAVTGTSALTGKLTFVANAGERTAGIQPTLGYLPGAGNGGIRDSGIEGTSMAGKVYITTGANSVAAGRMLRVNFNAVLSDANYSVQLTRADDSPPDVGEFVDYSTLTTSYWELSFRETPDVNTSYHFYYRVIQHEP